MDFARNRSNVYLAFAIIFLAIGIAIAWITYAYDISHSGLLVAYLAMICISILLFARTIYYRRMKVSVIEGPI